MLLHQHTLAVYGGVTKGDHHWGRYNSAVLIRPVPGEAAALRSDPRFFVPAYWGPSGWVGMDFTAESMDWTEVADLVEDSIRCSSQSTVLMLGCVVVGFGDVCDGGQLRQEERYVPAVVTRLRPKPGFAHQNGRGSAWA